MSSARLPQELLDHCIDLLAEDLEDYCLVLARKKWESDASRSARSALFSASCTSTATCHRTRSHIFRSVGICDAPYFPKELVEYDTDLGYTYVHHPKGPLKEKYEVAVNRLMDRISTLLEIMTWKPLHPGTRTCGISHGVAPYIETFGILETYNFGVQMFFRVTKKLAPILDLLQSSEARLKEFICYLKGGSYLEHFHPSFLASCYSILRNPRLATLRLRGLSDALPMLAQGQGIRSLTLDHFDIDDEAEAVVAEPARLPSLDHLIIVDISVYDLLTLLTFNPSHLRRLSLCMSIYIYNTRTEDIIWNTPLLEHLDLGWRYTPIDFPSFDLSTLHKLRHLSLCHRGWPSERTLDCLASVLDQLTQVIRSSRPPPSLQSMDIVICFPRMITKDILEGELDKKFDMGSAVWACLEDALISISPYCTSAINFIIHVLPRPSWRKKLAFRELVIDEVTRAMPTLASGRASCKKFDVTVLFGGEETATWSPVCAIGGSFDSGYLEY